tara:strand:+ start:308 stop:1222 length:915 start_codon:yes stop_codon:yes gene_type:complete
MLEISVIIPTYKRPILLKRAIKSVLNQNYSDFELLIINDDIQDEKPVLNLIQYLNDSRIKFYNNTRKKGANGARNTGILASKGKYICFLDDDDEWLPEKLGKQLLKFRLLDHNTWGAVYCGRFNWNNKKWFPSGNLLEGNLQYKILKHKISLNLGSTLMISRAAINDIGLFDEDLIRHQEIEFILRFFEKYKLGAVNQRLAKIYPHNIPHPNTYEKAKLLYLEKIKSLIDKQNLSDQKYIYAISYRSLASVFSKNGNIKQTIFYLNKSINHRILNPIRYIKLLLYIFRSICIKYGKVLRNFLYG